MQQLINKVKTYLGFAIKSGQITFGYDNILCKRNNKLIIVSTNLNEKIISKLCDMNVMVIRFKNITIDELLERNNVKAISITDKSLAEAILNCNELFDKLS